MPSQAPNSPDAIAAVGHSREFRRSIELTVLVALIVVFGFAGPRAATAQDAVGIQLTDGRVLDAIVTGIDDRQVSWRSPNGGVTQPIPYDRIDTINFLATPQFSAAMELFNNGEIEKAVALFKPISLDATARNYFPAPGNFATLSMRRLLDCYRALSKPTDIAYIQENIAWEKLPKHERDLAAVIDLWAAVGNGKWQQGVAAAETARKAYRTTDPEMNEIGFLLGIVYENLEDPETAIVNYGEGYGLATSNPRLAATSMIGSAKLLKNFPDRETELKSTLHLYAELIGNGELWTGADPEFVTLLKRPEGAPEMKAPSGDLPPPPAPAAEEKQKPPAKPAEKGKGKGKGKGKE